MSTITPVGAFNVGGSNREYWDDTCNSKNIDHHTRPSLGNSARGGAPHNGGVWEFTSTIMDEHKGYKASLLYPGYSSDFFDGLHHVVVRVFATEAPFTTNVRSSSVDRSPRFHDWHNGVRS